MPSIGPDDAALHPGQVGVASPLLFERLIDDAAMFPPGDAPLERAVSEHLGHRAAWYGGLVGPLLVRTADVAELAGVVAAQGLRGALAVGVIAPGGVAEARAALATARARPELEVVAIELPLASAGDLSADWTELGAGGRRVWWEVAAGESDALGDSVRGQLDRLARAVPPAALGGAKLRTGGVTPEAFPDEALVARFLRHAIDVDLTFKLTAGLHHAVRRTDPDTGLEQHGVLNVLCAIKAALNGAEEPGLEEVLAQRDPADLVDRAHGMSAADASVIRAFWSSFGCCGVTDPIDDLVALGLVDSNGQPGGGSAR
jgi:hypothetical protein